MNRIKRTIIILLAAVLALSAGGCRLVAINRQRDIARAVAEVEGLKITRAEFLSNYYSIRDYYGITQEIEQSGLYDEEIQEIKEYVLEVLISAKLEYVMAARNGFDALTAEQEAEIASNIDQTLSSRLELYRIQATGEMGAGAGDEAIEARARQLYQKWMSDNVIDRDRMIEYDRQTKLADKFREDQLKTLEVTDVQVKDKYDTMVAAQQKNYTEDPSQYATASQNSENILVYNPPGYAHYRNILIRMDQDKADELSAKRSAIYDKQTTRDTKKTYLETMKRELADLETQTGGTDEEIAARQKSIETYKKDIQAGGNEIGQLADEADALTREADALRDEYLADIKGKAEDALGRVQAGEDFEKLIAQLGEDSGMQEVPEGYIVGPESAYSDAYKTAALALEKVGDTTGLVATDYGYYIIRRVSDIPEGVVPFEQAADAVRASLEQETMDNAWSDLVSAWMQAAKIKRYINRL